MPMIFASVLKVRQTVEDYFYHPLISEEKLVRVWLVCNCMSHMFMKESIMSNCDFEQPIVGLRGSYYSAAMATAA